nr:hypothetical protein [Deltaproteobacteria bacterium]
MRRDLAARAVFDLVDASPAGDARPPSSLPYDGPRSELTPTTNTQPAILAIGVVCLRAPSAGRATEASDV